MQKFLPILLCLRLISNSNHLITHPEYLIFHPEHLISHSCHQCKSFNFSGRLRAKCSVQFQDDIKNKHKYTVFSNVYHQTTCTTMPFTRAKCTRSQLSLLHSLSLTRSLSLSSLSSDSLLTLFFFNQQLTAIYICFDCSLLR